MNCTADELLGLSKDSNYHDLGALPSQGIPYGDVNLKFYIRPFGLQELKLLSKAVELDDVVHLMRAVDNVISMSVDQLTIGDFFYVMLWLRINSMPKSPYIVEWNCQQTYFTHKETKTPMLYTDDHWPTVEKLKAEYKAEPCNTENTSVVHQVNVDVVSLEEDFVLPEGFDFPRMTCYTDRAIALKDPEFALLAPAIQWLPGNTWAEKMLVADATPSAIGEALDLNRKIVHGIAESVTFNCRKCRIEHTQKLELTALSFFQ